MKLLEKLLVTLAVAMTPLAGALAQAAASVAASASKAAIPVAFTNAQVRKVDKEGKKVVLKHEEIVNLGMPPMAMVFEVRDASVLEQLKAGDKIRFKAIWEAGKYLAVDIEPVK